MPDSTYLNNKTKFKNTYDAIIVGSGISGGWAAKGLCEKGIESFMTPIIINTTILIILLF